MDTNRPFIVMVYIFQYIKEESYEQKNSSIFAAFVQSLINEVVKDLKFKLSHKYWV